MQDSRTDIKVRILALIINNHNGMIRAETEFDEVVCEVWALFEIDDESKIRPYASNWDGEISEWMMVWSAIAGKII